MGFVPSLSFTFLVMAILTQRLSSATASPKLGVTRVLLSAPASTNPSSTSLTNSTADYLDVHNRARAEVGVGPIEWSPTLAGLASSFARLQRNYNHCNLSRSTTTPYGGNECWGKGRPMSPREAVETWVAQKAFYDYANNSCVRGNELCGVYTQVVWRRSVRLGCAQASCDAGDITLTVCYYDPPDNVVGEKPY